MCKPILLWIRQYILMSGHTTTICYGKLVWELYRQNIPNMLADYCLWPIFWKYQPTTLISYLFPFISSSSKVSWWETSYYSPLRHPYASYKKIKIKSKLSLNWWHSACQVGFRLRKRKVFILKFFFFFFPKILVQIT